MSIKIEQTLNVKFVLG